MSLKKTNREVVNLTRWDGNCLLLYIEFDDGQLYAIDNAGNYSLFQDLIPGITTQNIYNSDGIVTQFRTVDLAENSIQWINGSEFSIATDTLTLALSTLDATANNATLTVSGSATVHAQILELSSGTNGGPEGGVIANVDADQALQLFSEGGIGVGLNRDNIAYILPVVDGIDGQVLSTDGAGNVFWQTVNPGAYTNIYNSDGGLNGDRVIVGNAHNIAWSGFGQWTIASLDLFSISSVGTVSFYATDAASLQCIDDGITAIPGQLTLFGTNPIKIQDTNAPTNYWTLPLSRGLTGQVLMIDATTGAATWQTVTLTPITYNVTVEGGDNVIQAYEDGTNVSGTGTLHLLNTLTDPNTGLAYTNTSAAAAFPTTAALWGGINVATTSYDDVVVQEAFNSLAGPNLYHTLTSQPGKRYQLYRCFIVIPSQNTYEASNQNSLWYSFDGRNCHFRNASGAARTLFVSSIANQTYADTVVDNKWEFANFSMTGILDTPGDIGMQIGASRSAIFRRIEFKNFDIGLLGAFLLNSRFEEVNTNQCLSAGIKITLGWWTGAGASNSGSQPMFINCRLRQINVNSIGIYLEGCETIYGNHNTFEGKDGLYGLYWDNLGSSYSKNCEFWNTHAEMDNSGVGNWGRALFGVTGRDILSFKAGRIFNQWNTPDGVLIEATNTGGTNTIIMEDCLGNTGGNRWLIKNINTSGAGAWRFVNSDLQGDPTTSAQVITFPNIWASGSTIPPAQRIYIQPRLL